MEVGNLSSREIESSRAVAELLSHYGGGQQSRENGAEAIVEQAQRLTATREQGERSRCRVCLGATALAERKADGAAHELQLKGRQGYRRGSCNGSGQDWSVDGGLRSVLSITPA
jgi:hypothetical protein